VTRVAYVQCSAGVAGDMLLGALVDAGAPAAAVTGALERLGLDGYALAFEPVQRAGVAATRAVVDVATGGRYEHRRVRRIRELLAAADLPGPVRDRALAVFAALAAAEGAVHGVDPDDVELHEVGAIDAIVDVVGIAAALDALALDELVAGPVGAGHGTIGAAHGNLPNPPPAVARLLASRRMPVIGVDTDLELATPTGVAVLAALATSFGPPPPMNVTAIGCGAGRADPPGRANVVQVIVGETGAATVAPAPGRAAVQLDVNVDDVTGEVIAHTIAVLIDTGAFDAWATPIVMKKGRPAHVVSALCDPALVERIAGALVAETGSLGVRATTVERWPQTRRQATVDVDGHRIGVKLAAGRVKVEYDDAVAAAGALGRPLRDVLDQAGRQAADEQAGRQAADDQAARLAAEIDGAAAGTDP
jgi:uncharacterized protein (TIGR00299 family) protein